MLILTLLFACSTEPTQSKDEKSAALVQEQADMAAAPKAEADADGWKHWGEEFTVEQVTPAATLLANPAEYQGKTLKVSGKIGEVCQAKGCWMVIADQDKTMRVLMKDHAFGVDMDIAGQDCMVEGTVTVRELDPEFIEHLASESEHPENMPEKTNAQDGKVFEFEATGVSSRKG